jgi:uncharacterized membrane protein
MIEAETAIITLLFFLSFFYLLLLGLYRIEAEARRRGFGVSKADADGMPNLLETTP